jgi:very-short-patch-repair endonuclease
MYCCRDCTKASIAKQAVDRWRALGIKCKECSTSIPCPNRNQRISHTSKGIVYCSKECSSAAKSRSSSITMAETNRKYASARMLTNNPMQREEVRQKVSRTLREIGHGPKVQGGNGRGATPPQQILQDALGWQTECIVRTGALGKVLRAPHHYKVDLAAPALMIGIEIDGSSHASSARKEQDGRKDLFFQQIGWKLLRFKNQEVLDDLEGCLTKIKAAMSTT